MYDFYYGYIKHKYGDNAKLLFTDTDSLCYEIKTNDIYQDVYENKELFDLSDIDDPRFDKYKDVTNKKVIGKMKPEYVNYIIEEFIGLRSKMYSVMFEKIESKCAICDKPKCMFENGHEEKKAKGIVKSVVKNIKYEMYKNILETGGKMYSNMNT